MRRDQADIAMVIVLTSWSRELWPHLPVWTALQLELLDQGGDLVVGLYEPLPRPAVHRGQAHWAWGEVSLKPHIFSGTVYCLLHFSRAVKF